MPSINKLMQRLSNLEYELEALAKLQPEVDKTRLRVLIAEMWREITKLRRAIETSQGD